MCAMKDRDEVEAREDLDPVIEAYKKDVDVTLIRENLRLTVDQRFQQLMKLQQFAADLDVVYRRTTDNIARIVATA